MLVQLVNHEILSHENFQVHGTSSGVSQRSNAQHLIAGNLLYLLVQAHVYFIIKLCMYAYTQSHDPVI